MVSIRVTREKEELNHTPGSVDEHVEILGELGLGRIGREEFNRAIKSSSYVVIAVDPYCSIKEADVFLLKYKGGRLRPYISVLEEEGPDVIVTTSVQRYPDSKAIFGLDEIVGSANLHLATNLDNEILAHIDIKDPKGRSEEEIIRDVLGYLEETYSRGELSSQVGLGNLRTNNPLAIESFCPENARYILMGMQGNIARDFILTYILASTVKQNSSKPTEEKMATRWEA